MSTRGDPRGGLRQPALLAPRPLPFEAVAADGARLALRVKVEAVTDVGSVMPHLGGASFRYDPLPAALVARQRRLRFVDGDGRRPRTLSFTEARGLAPG